VVCLLRHGDAYAGFLQCSSGNSIFGNEPDMGVGTTEMCSLSGTTITCDMASQCGSLDTESEMQVAENTSKLADSYAFKLTCKPVGAPKVDYCIVYEDDPPEVTDIVVLGTENSDWIGFFADIALPRQLEALAGGPDLTASAYGLGGHDILVGSVENDSSYTEKLYGGDGPDHLFAKGGNDFLYGGADADVLDGGAHDDVIEGGTHDDWVIGGIGRDSGAGESGDDVICGDVGVGLLSGLELRWSKTGHVAYTGTQTPTWTTWGLTRTGMCATSGSTDTSGSWETADGGAGADVIRMASIQARIKGGSGLDRVWGSDKSDQMCDPMNEDDEYYGLGSGIDDQLYRATSNISGPGLMDNTGGSSSDTCNEPSGRTTYNCTVISGHGASCPF